MKRQIPKKRHQEITFEGVFEPSLRKKVEDFLESGGRVAMLTRGLLLMAVIGGVLGIGIAAPGLLRVIGTGRGQRSRYLSREGFYRLRRSFYQLQRQKLIGEVVDFNKKKKWRLTSAGMGALNTLLDRNKIIPIPRSWDKKWRLIFFDIPHVRKVARNAFRRELQAIGCYQFQKSVWIYPFPCSAEVLKITSRLDVKQYVEVCTVDDFSNPAVLSFFHTLLEDFL